MFEGMLVEYRVIILIGKQGGKSELYSTSAGLLFVDEQKIGPYKLCIIIMALRKSRAQELIDRVSYKPPFGFQVRL